MIYKMSGAQIHGDIEIGEDSSIWYNAVLRADQDKMKIGERTNIQDCCVCHVSKDHPLIIGKDVTVGHGAILHGCTIEDECLIGMGSIIMNGAVIHKHCIVGAGALVTEGKEFEENSLILGSPAKVVRKLSKEEIQSILDSSIEYIHLAKIHKKDEDH